MTSTHILITGASSGLGASLALIYASPATRLTLWGRDRDRLHRVAELCTAQGAVVETVLFDLREAQKIEAQIEHDDAQMPIDLAIFNAGLGGTTPVGRSLESGTRAFDIATVNFTATVIGASVVGELMVGRKRGHIAIVSSLADSIPLPMSPTYAGSKAGLKMFAESLRARVKDHAVTVTLLSPAFIDTPMSRQIKAAKPFMMTADGAAKLARGAIDRRRKDYAFPWSYALMGYTFGLLPRMAQRAIVKRLPAE